MQSGDRVVEFSLVSERDAQVAVRFRILGLERDRLSARCDGLRHLAKVSQQDTEIDVRFSEIRIDSYGLANEINSKLYLSSTGHDDAK